MNVNASDKMLEIYLTFSVLNSWETNFLEDNQKLCVNFLQHKKLKCIQNLKNAPLM